MLPFVDISENQGVYNMSTNTDQLIAIRMSTGEFNRFDFQAATNYAHASAMGKRILQYHYPDPKHVLTVQQEASLFLAACSPFAEHDLYCLDPETGQTKEFNDQFDALVYAATGCHVIDYGNISWTNSIGASPDCALWLAAPSWPFTADITELNTSVDYIMQQGPVVDGVDTNMCFIALEVLDAYGYKIPTQVPEPPAPVTPTQASAVVIPPVTPPAETTPVETEPVEASSVSDSTAVQTTSDIAIKSSQTTPVNPTGDAMSIPVKVTKTIGTSIDGILPAGTVVQPTDANGKSLDAEDSVYDDVGFIQNIVNLFKGRKTYLASALMLLTGVEKYFTGSHTLSQYITTTQGLFGSVGVLGITIRAAISKLGV